MSAVIATERLFAEFRDAARFMQLCRECPNFAHSYLCPPLGHDAEFNLAKYAFAEIHVIKITPLCKEVSSSLAEDLLLPHRIRHEAALLEAEKRKGGLVCCFGGRCRHCGDAPCARLHGLPCRHPESVRPSLEAYGFDVGAIVSTLFGIDMLWPTADLLPRYLLLVGARFHD